jgi:hypothetical protein
VSLPSGLCGWGGGTPIFWKDEVVAKKTISQSKTQYIKKGQKLSDGTVAKKGYVARKGNDLKTVTANVRLTATGDSLIGTDQESKRLKGKKIGAVDKAQPSRGGGKGGGGSKGGSKGGSGNNTSNSTTAPPTDAQKKATRIAKTTVKARTADTQKRKSGTAKTTTTLAKPKVPKGFEGPKGSDRQRVNAGARIDGVKASKRSSSGLDASNWGKGGGSPLSLPNFLKPGKNAPKMPKYTSSSSNYKWKG